jgi:hypothetical protein
MNYTSGQDIAAATMQIEASDQNQFGQVRIQCKSHKQVEKAMVLLGYRALVSVKTHKWDSM